MIDKTKIQIDSIITELRIQRDQLGDRAVNLAAELACEKAEKAMLEGRIKSLEEDKKNA